MMSVYIDSSRKSHPSWVCGLKPNFFDGIFAVPQVTPFVGVWIETSACHRKNVPFHVTPFVGVWIETQYKNTSYLAEHRHTLRGCVD